MKTKIQLTTKARFRYIIWFMISEKSITFIQSLKITFIWTWDFYRYNQVYTYGGQDFQNIL